MNGLNSVVLLALISQLGSPAYKTRERATAALAKSMPAAFVELHAVERSTDHEVARRATKILNKYYSTTAEAKADMAVPIGLKDMPWIDETSTLSVEEAQFWLAQARLKIGVHGPPDWQDYRLATRMYVTTVYEDRGSSTRVAQILNTLHASEKTWITTLGYMYYPTVFSPPILPPPQPRRVDDLPR